MFTLVFLQYTIEENDYRQGFDYNILNLHLSATILTYIFFTLVIIVYIIELVYTLKIKYIYIINKIAAYLSLNVLTTGFIWSWSQWGTLQIYDVKVMTIGLIFILFTTVSFILKITKKINLIIIFYNFYILYHIPLLKYNVIWNSEIHQKNTFYLVEFYMVSYNGLTILFIIATILISTIYTIEENNKQMLLKNKRF